MNPRLLAQLLDDDFTVINHTTPETNLIAVLASVLMRRRSE